jgi:methyl-accepting chemotaxis protein
MMIFRLTTAVAFAVGRRDAAAPSLYPDIHQGQPSLGGRSIRHTVAEALALTGAIPLLALGYIIVRYVLWIKTHESVLLIVGIVSVVLILGIIRINSLIRRLLSVAAAARSVRMETRVPGWDFGRDEIGALSADIAHIAEKLSTRMAELRRT